MIRNTIIGFIILLSGLSLQSQNFDDLSFGTDTTFEVMTWNIEWFPKNGQNTIYYVSQIIEALDIDIIGVQEIDNKAKLNQMIENLDGWETYLLYGEYQSLAYIYKSSTVEFLDAYEIYTEDWREFPRSPLVIEILFKNVKHIIINNHLKCCGDGEMNLFDAWDEETRRYDACIMLEEFISSTYPDERVILLGDLNDILSDGPENNVFKPFLDLPYDYVFADMDIAMGSSSGWSYPNWPSHLDHLMLSNELFYDFWDDRTEVQTIKIDDFFPGGMEDYDQNVSDHRPVAVKFPVPDNFGTRELRWDEHLIKVSPNPASTYIKIDCHESIQPGKAELYSSTGEMLLLSDFEADRINVSNLQPGLYLLLVYHEQGVVSRKIIIAK